MTEAAAARVTRDVPALLRTRLPHARCREDSVRGVLDMLLHFMAGGALECADALRIVTRAKALLSRQRNLLHLPAPVMVVGDVHGQLYDLAKVLALASPLGTQPLLFLGNYIGGGGFSVECALVLLALKVACPQTVHLLRGNHECRLLARVFALDTACVQTYSPAVYEALIDAFHAMPLAAVVARAYFCVHAGISMDIAALDDLDAVCRTRETPMRGALCDLLWSDPYWDCDNQVSPGAATTTTLQHSGGATTVLPQPPQQQQQQQQLYSAYSNNSSIVDPYVPHTGTYKMECTMMENVARGCGSLFNYACVKYFLTVNKLRCVVRSHEVQDAGYKLYRPLPESTFPCMIGVYSAPNVADAFDNLGAVLHIRASEVSIAQYYAAPHPYVLHGLNALTWSLPYAAQKARDVLAGVVCAKRSRSSSEGSNTSAAAAAAVAATVHRM